MALKPSRNVRVAMMLSTIVAIVALGVFGGRWATPAMAAGTVGPSAASVGGPCGLGAQEFTLTGAANVTKLLDVGIGTVRLLSNQGGVGTGAVRPLVVPISSLTVDLIDSLLLKTSPVGWTSLACGIMTSAKVEGGQAATFIVKGQQICFNLPVGATSLYKNLRIAYYDTGLARWVFLKTTVGATQACHSSFRLTPTTFALFGGL